MSNLDFDIILKVNIISSYALEYINKSTSNFDLVSYIPYIYTPTKVRHHLIVLSIYFLTSILLKQ
jgi:hypothetical protein